MQKTSTGAFIRDPLRMCAEDGGCRRDTVFDTPVAGRPWIGKIGLMTSTDVVQWLEPLPSNGKVPGSNPGASSLFSGRQQGDGPNLMDSALWDPAGASGPTPEPFGVPLVVQDHALRYAVIFRLAGPKRLPPVGFEPTPSGIQARRSTS